ncbi:MAG: ATP-binding protein [Proteobacteria bacterium]|nr:MAG: ATP-binding protein [Pseudomonadota bacterium]
MEQGKKSSCGGGSDPFAAQLQDRAINTTLGKIRHKLFVMSGKGGVGKSTVAVNLAAALAKQGKRVGLLDVDIHGPNVPRLLGLEGGLEATSEKILQPKPYNDNLSVVSMDSLLRDTDQAVLWRGPMKTNAIRQFISDVNWGELDFLVIDSPPGTGDEPMTVLQTVPDCKSIVVTTPREVSLADVRKALNFLQHAEASILGIVESMNGLVCPHCQEAVDIFKSGGGEQVAREFELAFLGKVPMDPKVVVAGDDGKPYLSSGDDSPAVTAFQDVVGAVEKRVPAIAPPPRGLDLGCHGQGGGCACGAGSKSGFGCG